MSIMMKLKNEWREETGKQEDRERKIHEKARKKVRRENKNLGRT